MNLAKKNLWVIRSVQAGRMLSSGTNWAQKSDGSCAGSPIDPVKPADSKKSGDPMKHMSFVAPPAINEQCEHVRMTQQKAMAKQAEIDKETGLFLSRYYGDQIKYFREVSKTNSAAMKRIKKLRKDWLRFCEKHF